MEDTVTAVIVDEVVFIVLVVDGAIVVDVLVEVVVDVVVIDLVVVVVVVVVRILSPPK